MEKNEIERKFAVTESEKKAVQAYLSQNGFIYEGKNQIVDDYYLVIENSEYLRIRHTKSPTLDHHKVINEDTCEEISVPILDTKGMAIMLNKLGYEHQITVDKTRVAYTNSQVEVVLDYLEGLGNFVEIEVYEGTREDMNNLVDQLELTNEVKKRGYPDLLISHTNKNK